MKQEITDEDGMLEDITFESASTVESVGSGDSGEIIVEMDTSCHKTKRHHTGGPSAHVHLYHNSLTYNSFNLIMSEEFRSGILH